MVFCSLFHAVETAAELGINNKDVNTALIDAAKHMQDGCDLSWRT